MFGVTEGGTPWHAIGVAPIFIWELSLGLWMTFKGFNALRADRRGSHRRGGRSRPGSATSSPAPAAVATKAGAA